MGEDDKVQPGYEIARDDAGLTARERQALGLLRSGKSQIEVAEEMGVTRARVAAIAKQIRAKGVDVPTIRRRRW